jgi:hypothetical protein
MKGQTEFLKLVTRSNLITIVRDRDVLQRCQNEIMYPSFHILFQILGDMFCLGLNWTMMLILLSLVVGLLPSASACKGRQVLNVTSGDIFDGRGEYPASAHCEWLIVGETHLLSMMYQDLSLCFYFLQLKKANLSAWNLCQCTRNVHMTIFSFTMGIPTRALSWAPSVETLCQTKFLQDLDT